MHLNLGRVLYAMARYEDADKSVTIVVEREPDNGEAWLLEGKIDLELRRYDAALDHLNRALELLPEEAGVWRNVSMILRHKVSAFSELPLVFRGA